MFVARRRKRYGTIQARAIRRPPWTRKPKGPEAELFVVPMGVACHVRRLSGGPWQEQTTRLRLVCHGFTWQNESHIGLANAGWELKLRKTDLEQAL